MLDQSSKGLVDKVNLCKCPVFKIDLNGRFVFLDELSEDLFGIPGEQLYGRSIEEYLDYESYAALLSIMHSGKHYESTFQAVTLTFVDARKHKNRLDVIIALNFIAGNPANYQIIINATRKRKTAFKVTDEDNAVDHLPAYLFDYVASLGGEIDWTMLCDILLEIEDVKQVGIYTFDNNSLDLIEQKARDDEESPVDFGQSNENHIKAAQLGKPYIKPESMEVVSDDEIIYGGNVDVVCPLTCAGTCWGLIRLIHTGDHNLLDSKLQSAAGFIGNALYSFARSKQPAETVEA